MNVNVAIIPAKGTSNRIPKKNVRPFHGKPILAYSIETALQSGLFDGGVWVSSENAQIQGCASMLGAGFILRPPELAEIGAPDCGTQRVAAHAIERLRANIGYMDPGYAIDFAIDFACCIYPCAPLMTIEDLKTGWDWIKSGGYDYAFTRGWYYWGRAQTFIDRPDDFRNSMEIDVPARWIDINVEEDWNTAERLYAELHKNVT